MRRPNHWVSKWGPFDRCSGCGEAVPNATERGPTIITGHCTALDLVPRELLVICHPCLARPPYFGLEDPGWGHLHFLHPGWCMLCRAWMGDAFAIVQRRAPIADLVSALFEWPKDAFPTENPFAKDDEVSVVDFVRKANR